jgi:hypothetical protein
MSFDRKTGVLRKVLFTVNPAEYRLLEVILMNSNEIDPLLTMPRYIDRVELMKRDAYIAIFFTFTLFAIFAIPLSAATREDRCSEEGIIVKNLTTLDLWYKKNSGVCSMWKRNHIFRIKPGDRMEIFSDLSCGTLYCGHNPRYKDYRSLDTNGDCRVRILPRCNISDM